MFKRLCTIVAVCAVVFAAVIPSTAQAASTPTRGTGWKLTNDTAIGLSAQGYTFKFTSSQAATRLTPYTKNVAKQLQMYTNVPFTVSTTVAPSAYTATQGDILINYLYRPCKNGQPVTDGSGKASFSCAYTWWNNAYIVTRGAVYINSEYFTSSGAIASGYTQTLVNNTMAHELAHSIGLDHPNLSSADYDCVHGADSKERPTMCSPNGGYQDTRSGQYVQQFDVQGLRRLALNGGIAVPPQGRVLGLGSKCLDVRDANPANGAQIQILTCDGAAAKQTWLLFSDGTIRALGKCLDNSGGKNVNGNKIQLYTCNGGAAQKWSYDAATKHIINTATKKVLDVKGGSTADKTVVQLYTANTNKRQQWTVPQ